MTHRRRTPHRSPQHPDTLPRRFAIALAILAAVLLIRHYDPTLLEPLREPLTANTGAVAEAFARFSDTVGEGEPVVEAWAVLTEDLAALTAGAHDVSPQEGQDPQ